MPHLKATIIFLVKTRTLDMVRTFTQSEQAADTVILAGPCCMQVLMSRCEGKPRARIAPLKLTTLFLRAAAPPASGRRENRCKTRTSLTDPPPMSRVLEAGPKPKGKQ